ncbi:MAG: hypothetical protein V3R33_06635 [Anaerolineales bacterium]
MSEENIDDDPNYEWDYYSFGDWQVFHYYIIGNPTDELTCPE